MKVIQSAVNPEASLSEEAPDLPFPVVEKYCCNLMVHLISPLLLKLLEYYCIYT